MKFNIKSLSLLILLFLLGGAVADAVLPSVHGAVDSRACSRWVDSVYNSMTERERIAQLVFPVVAPNQGAQSRATIKRLVQGNHVGGLLFSKGSLANYAEMINYAQSLSKVPLMITFDGEWGPAMRIEGSPRFPKNMALGAITNPSLLFDYGQEVAREMREMGVQVNYAPVLDVNSNPSNPVIGMRSFGEDPMRVAVLGMSYSRGLEQGNVMAVAKHFPGHGNTSTDSHHTLAVVDRPAGQLDSIDLLPFRAFIDAGCSGVMTGHIVLPALDSSRKPASLSHKITTDLLRDRMGFKGLIFTDALAMKGAAVSGKNNALLALKAGADVLESSSSPITDIDVIADAVKSGEISAKDIETKCKHILTYKYLLGLASLKPTKAEGLQSRLQSPEAKALARQLTAATMTILRNNDNILPIADLDKNSIAVVNIGEPADNDFAKTCSRYAAVDNYSTSAQALSAATLSKIKNHDIVIAAVYSDSQQSQTTMSKLKDCQGLVTVFFVSPYRTEKYAPSLASAKAILLAYENAPYAQEYAAQALFGGIDVTGKLPVNLPKIAKIGIGIQLKKSRLGYATPLMKGMNPQLTDSLDRMVKKLIADGGMPGCQLLVANGGDVVYDKCFGLTTAGGPKVTNSTVYDLASVSKAAGTLPGIMKAYDMKLFKLDEPMSRYVPGLKDGDKSKLRIRDFFYHETGMPASLDMNRLMVDTASYKGKLISSRRDKLHTIRLGRRAYGSNTARLRRDITAAERSERFPIEAAEGIFVGQSTYDTIMNRIYEIPLRAKNYRYSCLNFCLLMDLEQRLTGRPHDLFVADSVFAPLGAYSTFYRAAEHYPQADIAPTEKDRFLRKQHIQGYVHDELAAFSGGVQGNAGLFSNATDLAKLCQMWLNGGVYGGHRFLTEKTVQLFTESKSPTCRRGLGFDKPDAENPDKSPTCEEADPSVFGHLGFTGTVFWVDPANDMFLIFLTNRVNPTRETPVFNASAIRPELFRLVYKYLRA